MLAVLDVAGMVLAEHPLAVALAVLHIEWMTQEHYLRSVRGSVEMDPKFKDMLRFHWVEEAQHARIEKVASEDLSLVRPETTDIYVIERP